LKLKTETFCNFITSLLSFLIGLMHPCSIEVLFFRKKKSLLNVYFIFSLFYFIYIETLSDSHKTT